MYNAQGYNARKVICSCVYSANILKPVLSGRNLLTRIDASVFVYYPMRIKAYDQNILLFFFMWKMDPMSGCHIRLVFTLPPRDSTLQYKRCVHLWNYFPCIITLVVIKNIEDKLLHEMAQYGVESLPQTVKVYIIRF